MSRHYRIAVFRALQLGDMLCAVPALRALRQAFGGEAEITLIGLPWAKEFLVRFPDYLDRHLAFSGHPELPEQPYVRGAFEAFVAAVRAYEFDLVIQMHGNGSITNAIVAQFGAKTVAGWCSSDSDRPGGRFMPLPEDLSEVDRCLKLMTFLSITADNYHLEFPIYAAEQYRARSMLRRLGISMRGTVIGIHPGARAAERRWAPTGFIEVGRYLAACGHTILITGAMDEAEECREIADAIGPAAYSTAGETSLGELAALLTLSDLLICNDTGVSHLAAAVGARSIVLFSASEPRRWAPRDSKLHRQVQTVGLTLHQVVDEVLSHAVEHLDDSMELPPGFSQVEA